MLRLEQVSKRAIVLVSSVLLAVLVVCAALSEHFAGFERARRVESVEVATAGGTQTYDLPGSVPSLPAHSRATITFTANVRHNDELCLHSVYSSYQVYANGRLLASYGTGDDAPPHSCATPPPRCTPYHWRAYPVRPTSP